MDTMLNHRGSSGKKDQGGKLSTMMIRRLMKGMMVARYATAIKSLVVIRVFFLDLED